jgi:hypothetical protein
MTQSDRTVDFRVCHRGMLPRTRSSLQCHHVVVVAMSPITELQVAERTDRISTLARVVLSQPQPLAPTPPGKHPAPEARRVPG